MKQYIHFIQQVLSEKINNVEIVENGFHSIAYIINRQYVFRFPRSAEFYQEYENEAVILEFLKSNVSILIPQLKIHKIDNVLFTEHIYISGEQYSKLKSPLNAADKDLLAYDLAVFLMQLHQMSIPNLPYLPTEHQFNTDLIEKCPVLTLEEKEKSFRLLDDFQKYTCIFSAQDIVLCHTDLNENNFLLDNNRLVGIIDFGNACRREAATEFSALLKYDFDLVLRMVSYYQSLTGRKIDLTYAILFQKIRCFDGIMENSDNLNQVNRYRKWLNIIEEQEKLIK